MAGRESYVIEIEGLVNTVGTGIDPAPRPRT